MKTYPIEIVCAIISTIVAVLAIITYLANGKNKK